MNKAYKIIDKSKNVTSFILLLIALFNMVLPFNVFADEPSPVNKEYQIINEGGSNSSADNMVSVSKTLQGTDYENIFDITLQVQTKVNIEQLYSAQDTAVVIVMDISYTMKNLLSDGTSRYNAAISSAESFIKRFQVEAEDSNVQCKVGYVAFNTSAHKIVPLSDCNTTTQSNGIISDIKSGSDSIMYASGYASSPTRFTNIEAGLKMAYDMLNESGITNKYIIFLSDGFPTTYIKQGYEGYNPYMDPSENSNYASQIAGGIGSDGYFYNQKTGNLCEYGTSYSDKAADRAMATAANIKKETKIYSIGVGLGDQNINDFWSPIVDCYGNDYDYGTEGQNYVIGNDTAGFKSWLKNKIASGYYWDSTDTSGLETAYDEIFVDIKETNEESVKNVWLATDPMSATALSNVEFLHFYDRLGNKVSGNLVNVADPMTENTASINRNDGVDYIHWDLKNSVCVESGTENSRTYTYSLKYRIRLNTGEFDFVMGKEYETNGRTFLTYQTDIDGVLSDVQQIEFPLPSVKGHLGRLSFNKADSLTKKSLKGVTFTLQHSDGCSVCSTVDNLENISDLIAVSDDNGLVYFENIPSGHEYTLFESSTLEEYIKSDDIYNVKVGYSTVSSDLNTDVVYNSKILYAQDLVVKKEVIEETLDGSFITSNTDEEFEFTIEFSNMNEGTTFSSTIGGVVADSNGFATMTFYLRNGESTTFYDVPVGVQYQLAESANAYMSSYSIKGNSMVKSEFANTIMNQDITTEIEKIEVDEDVTITFTNAKFLNKAIHLKKSINTQGNDNILTSLESNSMYTLEGAEYQIIIDGEIVETLVTDINGEAVSSLEFEDGITGIVKEVTAPRGFLLDEIEYPFTIDVYNGTAYCEIEVSDVPTFDPTVFKFRKTDADTGVAQGNASFEGTVFKYEYFDNTDWSGAPVRTWYFATDENGIHGYHQDYLADGYVSDELYASDTGVCLIPLGSVKITEIVAPAGYKSMPVILATITQEANGGNAKWQFAEESLTFLQSSANNLYEADEPIDETKLGSLIIQKMDKSTGLAAPAEGATFEGCEFTIYNKSANPVKIGDNEIAQPNEACMVLVVGEDGLAATGNILPIGSYEVKETKGNDFYDVNSEWTYSFTIDGSENNPVFEAECENVLMYAISILKVDNEYNALSGATLQILDVNGNVIAEWISTDKDYSIRLEEGSYILHEMSAPSGYMKAEDIEFAAGSDSAKNIVMVDVPIPVLVSTGGTGALITIIAATVFGIVSMGCIYIGKKKERD